MQYSSRPPHTCGGAEIRKTMIKNIYNINSTKPFVKISFIQNKG